MLKHGFLSVILGAFIVSGGVQAGYDPCLGRLRLAAEREEAKRNPNQTVKPVGKWIAFVGVLAVAGTAYAGYTVWRCNQILFHGKPPKDQDEFRFCYALFRGR